MYHVTTPKISVCVITYNQIEYIRDCLNGIVNQVCDLSYEVVVGDDCSSDGTREIVQEYMDKYPGLIKGLLHESNMGAVPNFLAVLKECQGDFIAFCEGDDYWVDSSKLQVQVSTLHTNESLDLVFHPAIGRCSDYKGGDKILGYHGQYVKQITSEEIVAGRGGITPSASIMFRRTVVDKIPEWFSELAGCDYQLKCLAGARGGALYLPYFMSAYRISSKGSWTSKFERDGQVALASLEQAWKRSYCLQKLMEFSSQLVFDKLRKSYLFQVATTEIIPLSKRLVFVRKHYKEVGYVASTLAYLMALSAVARLVIKVIRKAIGWRQFVLNLRNKLSIY